MAVFISRPDFGLYVGHALGFGFWSLLDTAGQDCAVTFPDKQAAIDHINSWDNPPDTSDFSFHEVNDHSAGFVARSKLQDLGLDDLWPSLVPDL